MNARLKALKDPRMLIAASWPIVLAVPYLPGIPRPTVGGLAWKQELAFAAILLGTLALVIWQQSKARVVDLTLRGSPLLLTGVLFTTWIATSVFWATNPYSAIHYAVTWGAYILFFVLMRFVAASPRAMRTAFYALGAVICLLSVSCLIEWSAGAALTDYSFRASFKPIFRGFSGFGEMLAVAAPIFAALALVLRKRKQAVFCGVTSLIAWLVILQAFQRAPIIGAAIGFFVFGIGLVVFKRAQPRNFQRVMVMFGSLIILAFVQLTFLEKRSEWASSTLERLQATSTNEENTRVRLLYWGVGLEMFRAHPLLGVGGNNYEAAFPAGREQFAAAHPGSSLLGVNEQLLTQYAHNEYVQILAELGIVGILLFVSLAFFLILAFWRALRFSTNPLMALGAGAGLLAFAISSGASAFSFRWFGSGLMFFFAAAIVTHLASSNSREEAVPQQTRFSAGITRRLVPINSLVFALLMFLGASLQGLNGITHAWAQTAATPGQAENLYRQALRFNEFDAASHFDYGSLLYQQRRYKEATQHLQYAVTHGFNTSTSFALLAAAQEGATDLEASERTLAKAAKTYPRSIFILVRHAAALSRLGKQAKADQRFNEALALDSRAARGWYQLINFDIDAALSASQQDSSLAKPGELLPETAIYLVLKENEIRLNIPAQSGWRGRVGILAN